MARLNIQRARQLGLSDQQIQQYAQSKGVNLYDSSQAQAQPEQQGFNLADLLPIAGAVGGSFIPGLGTIVGGALGAGAGTLLRQGVKQQPLDIGEAGKEALFAGAGGAIGGKLLGPILGKLGSAGTRAATIAPKSGIPQFGRQEAIRKTASLFPQLRGGGATKFQNVEKVIDDLGNQVDDLFEGVKTTIPSQTFGQRASAIESTMSPNDARAFRNVYNRTIGKIIGDKPITELNANQVNAIKRAFNKQASAAYRSVEKGGVLSAPNQAVIELRDFTDDILTQLAPQETKAGVDLLNQQMRDLIEGIPEFKALSEQGVNFFGVRPPGAGIPSQIIQTVQDIGGRGAGDLAPQAARAGAGIGAALGGQPQPTGTTDELMPDLGIPQAEATQQAPQGDIQNIFRMLALQDLAQGGKNITKIAAVSKLFEGGVDANTRKKLNQLDQAELIITDFTNRALALNPPEQAPLARLKGAAVAVGTPLGLNSAQERAFNSNRQALRVLLARSLGEVGNLSEPEQRAALDMIPSLGDSREEVQLKAAGLTSLLRRLKETIQTSPQTQGGIPFPSDFSGLGL